MKQPKQKESLDCAIFVMKTGELLLKGETLSYSQEEIPTIRQEILGILYKNMEHCDGW